MTQSALVYLGFALAVAVLLSVWGLYLVNRRLFRAIENIDEALKKSETNIEILRKSTQERLDGIGSMVIESSKESQKNLEKQLQRNFELFSKTLETINDFKSQTKEILLNRFTEFSVELSKNRENMSKEFSRFKEDLKGSMGEEFEKNSNLLLKMSENNQKLFRDFLDSQKSFKTELSKELGESFESLNDRVSKNLERISDKVDERLKEGFENVDKTFKEIITGIAKIAEAQKNIESLSKEVVSLQNVLSDKKSRGVFGEVQLNSILRSIFGEKRELYDLQYAIDSENGKVVADAVIKAPDPVGTIAIDAKFPLENYVKMTQSQEEQEKKRAQSLFKQNLKKHILDISSKYIVKGKTASMAILFLPAEAIFAEINAYHPDILDFAREKKVWIASPTTLMALLTTVQAIVRDVKTQEQAKKIQEELKKLSNNFRLYKERWEKLSKHIESVNKDVKEIHTTTQKISKEFERIERVEFEDSALLDK